ncbi:hypothetical protein ACIRPT_24130 [Streptomyces sp. NPDC101227]|uniref:hypothetical protein n=1 Tax=Streptomyces sp. NPDC101227 TaxID=3366136 RepID=UPI0037F713FF
MSDPAARPDTPVPLIEFDLTTAGSSAAPHLTQLKAAMAAARPDRGGADAAFIAARSACEQARSRAGGAP